MQPEAAATNAAPMSQPGNFDYFVNYLCIIVLFTALPINIDASGDTGSRSGEDRDLAPRDITPEPSSLVPHDHPNLEPLSTELDLPGHSAASITISTVEAPQQLLRLISLLFQ